MEAITNAVQTACSTTGTSRDHDIDAAFDNISDLLRAYAYSKEDFALSSIEGCVNSSLFFLGLSMSNAPICYLSLVLVWNRQSKKTNAPWCFSAISPLSITTIRWNRDFAFFCGLRVCCCHTDVNRTLIPPLPIHLQPIKFSGEQEKHLFATYCGKGKKTILERGSWMDWKFFVSWLWDWKVFLTVSVDLDYPPQAQIQVHGLTSSLSERCGGSPRPLSLGLRSPNLYPVPLIKGRSDHLIGRVESGRFSFSSTFKDAITLENPQRVVSQG